MTCQRKHHQMFSPKGLPYVERGDFIAVKYVHNHHIRCSIARRAWCERGRAHDKPAGLNDTWFCMASAFAAMNRRD